MTTQLFWKEENDIILSPNIHSGIKKESVLRISKIATLDKSFIKGIIGRLDEIELEQLDKKLKLVFKLK